MADSTTAVSAPSKVFLAGGYLVLDRKYNALVFGLDARIHVHVRDLGNLPESTIVVQSPQFIDAAWHYSVEDNGKDGRGVNVIQLQHSTSPLSANLFVETTLRYVLTYIFRHGTGLHKSLYITILADHDYYSAAREPAQLGLDKKGYFSNFGVTLRDAHKTGLGSSAALVTALTTALLTHHLPNISIEKNQTVIHNLAQVAHCAAQGKIGSGFDIATAVYGSCLYRRFTPSILGGVGEAGSAGFGERLRQCVDDLDASQKWDAEVHKSAIKVPPSLRLIMCDVDCGSETPSMVKKLLGWRKKNPAEADLLWGAIQKGTDDICDQFTRLALLEDEGDEQYDELRDIFLTIRSLIREMTEKSGVPVEPKVQTELLDACSAIPGVIGGVVPGSGGYDAIALLVKNDETVVTALEGMLERWQSTVQEDSSEKIGHVRLLGVREEFEGVRTEPASKYKGWV